MLYTLVTDRVFLREPSIVWESIVDVDGESSSFYDSFMVGSTPAGGDFAGHTAEQIARMYDQRHNDAAMSVEYVRYPLCDRNSELFHSAKLARQLQLEEDTRAWEERHRMELQQRQLEAGEDPRRDPRKAAQAERPAAKKDKKKDKGDCIIM